MNRARNPIWLRKVDEDELHKCAHIHGDCDFLACIKSKDGTYCTQVAGYMLTDTPYCAGHIATELAAALRFQRATSEWSEYQAMLA